MQTKPTSVAGEFIYKVVTRKGYLVHTSTVCAGLKQCVALFNSEHAPAAPVSYDKAFRKVRTQGLHVDFSKCTWEVGTGALLPLVVIFSAAEPEIVPVKTPDLFAEIEAAGSGFQKGMGIAELAAVAQSINAKSGAAPLTEAQAIAQAQVLLDKFAIDIMSDSHVASMNAYVTAGYSREQALLLWQVDELEAFAEMVIADVDRAEIANTQTSGTRDELPF